MSMKLMNEREIEIFFQDFKNFKSDYVNKLDNYQIRGIFCYACEHKTVDVVKFICDKLIVHENFEKCSPNYHTKGFKVACNGNNLDVMNYLYDNYVINPNIYNDSILEYPCMMNYFDIVQFIVEHFPNLNYRPYRRNLISICCYRGHYKILYYLKSRYPDFDEDINHKSHGISSQNEEFREWFRGGCPIRTNMKPAKKI